MAVREFFDYWNIKRIFWYVLAPLTKWSLVINRVSYGKKVRVFGLAHISNDGKIVLGERVKLFSTNAFYLTHAAVPNCLLKTYKNGIITVGKNVELTGITIVCASKVEIGDNCMIGSNCVIFDTDIHPIDPTKRRQVCTEIVSTKPVTIGKNVWLGVNCTILKGVTIGDNSIIGAGSVVTGDVDKNSIFAGNPAKLIKKIK